MGPAAVTRTERPRTHPDPAGPHLFPRDAVIRRVDSEGILLLGGGRALLMQLAHPAVAQGVADHSDFRANPFRRLQRTLEASYTIVFGSEEQARATAAAVHAVHERVTGAGYRANDPELLLWVHATLVDTALRVHARFLRPLSPQDAECYYQESKQVAVLLGVPLSVQPPELGDFRAYVRAMVGSLQVSDTARDLARDVLRPAFPGVAAPAVRLLRDLTTGLLPPPLRAGFGLAWDPVRAAALDVAARSARQILPRLPAPLRRLPVRTFATR